MNPAAFFSIIFVDTTLYTPDPAKLITIDYSWYGSNGYTIQGEWVDLNFTLTVIDEDLVTYKDVLVPLKAFVSY